MEIKWTRAARKHHISQKSVRFVVENPAYRCPRRATAPRWTPRILFVGPDGNGVELEVMAVDRGSEPRMTKAKPKIYGTTKGGTVITEAVADELAAEAERGYDLRQGDVRRVGRPSLDDGVSPRVNFRITAELQQRALQRAQREGKTLSQLAREALEHYVETP